MNISNIIIVLGEPQSVFVEILFKYFKSKNFNQNKKKITLIGSKDILYYQMNKLNYNVKLNIINEINLAKTKLIRWYLLIVCFGDLWLGFCCSRR